MPDRRTRLAGALVVTAALLLSTSPASRAEVATPLGAAIGFGQATTGGGTAPVAWVTTLADDGPGSLRAAATRPEPLVIRFQVSGVIALTTNIDVGPNKTIDGRGADVTITKRGFKVVSSNVIVENLRFDDLRVPDKQDAIEISGAHDIWIDHCSFTGASDKAISLLTGTNVTISWNHFFDQVQVVQLGTYSTRDDGSDIKATVHHNYFEHTGYRNPRISYGMVHAFNNVLRDWETHGMSSVRGAQLLSERNMFEAGADKNAIIPSAGKQTKDHFKGFVRSSHDLLQNGAEIKQREPERVFDAHDLYQYTADEPSVALERTVEAGAGWQDVTPSVSGGPGGAESPTGPTPTTSGAPAGAPPGAAPPSSGATPPSFAAPTTAAPGPATVPATTDEDRTAATVAAVVAAAGSVVFSIAFLRRRRTTPTSGDRP